MRLLPYFSKKNLKLQSTFSCKECMCVNTASESGFPWEKSGGEIFSKLLRLLLNVSGTHSFSVRVKTLRPVHLYTFWLLLLSRQKSQSVHFKKKLLIQGSIPPALGKKSSTYAWSDSHESKISQDKLRAHDQFLSGY